MGCTADLRVPRIPQTWVGHLVGQQVARVVTHIVGGVEDGLEGHIDVMAFVVLGHHIVAFLVLDNLEYSLHLVVNSIIWGEINLISIILVIIVFAGQHDHTGRIDSGTNLTLLSRDVGLLHKQVAL